MRQWPSEKPEMVEYAKEYDRAVSTVTETASAAIRAILVNPLISHVEKPLQNLELGDENSIYLMEDELTSVIAELLTNKSRSSSGSVSANKRRICRPN